MLLNSEVWLLFIDLDAELIIALGIPTDILKIHWPRNKNPKEKQGFESLARKYRFRILGKACRALRINSMLLAHHEDDQVETVLMRMVSGHRLAGLAGIRECTEIPENYGCYGVHESGGNPFIELDSHDNPRLSGLHARTNHHLICEDGGIKLYRPLLGFSKKRLIATCKAEEMEWFEDHTNKDQTLTSRNAIRHIYAHNKVPSALSKASILNLSMKVKQRLALRKAVVDRWMSGNEVTRFETRSGVLVISFPHTGQLPSSEIWSISEKFQMAAELLRRVLMLVTPEQHVEIATLRGAVIRLFPELTGEEGNPSSGFTVAGVQFQPEDSLHYYNTNSKQMQSKPQWFLSRQPLPHIKDSPVLKGPSNDGSDPVTDSVSSSPTETGQPPKPSSVEKESAPKEALSSSMIPHRPQPLIIIPPAPALSEAVWSPWKLFDGRYWIRVQSLTTSPIKIKHFQSKHLSEFKHKIPKLYRDKLQHLLKTIAKGNIRWTLPVIVFETPTWSDAVVRKSVEVPSLDERAEGKDELWFWDVKVRRTSMFDRVLALPTLGIKAADADELVKWEVRYKKIYLDGIPMAPELKPQVNGLPVISTQDAPKTKSQCAYCGSRGHIVKECWDAHPGLKPAGLKAREAKHFDAKRQFLMKKITESREGINVQRRAIEDAEKRAVISAKEARAELREEIQKLEQMIKEVEKQWLSQEKEGKKRARVRKREKKWENIKKKRYSPQDNQAVSSAKTVVVASSSCLASIPDKKE
jgi:tRNA(Ile)-lysidine synthase